MSSMVGNDSHRLLDIEEVRGFTLHGELAPLVFVNAADTKSGQVFSLLHELAHVWRGESGVSAESLNEPADHAAEYWCNQVATEVAVPKADLLNRFHADAEMTGELDRLARVYLCSTLVILIRLRELGLLPRLDFDERYAAELARLLEFARRGESGGGDFYLNQPFRIGETLSRALVRDALRGRTSFTEAMSLMSFGSMDVFNKYAAKLGKG